MGCKSFFRIFLPLSCCTSTFLHSLSLVYLLSFFCPFLFRVRPLRGRHFFLSFIPMNCLSPSFSYLLSLQTRHLHISLRFSFLPLLFPPSLPSPFPTFLKTLPSDFNSSIFYILPLSSLSTLLHFSLPKLLPLSSSPCPLFSFHFFLSFLFFHLIPPRANFC